MNTSGDEARGGAHVHDLGRTGIPDYASTSHDEDAALVHFESRIVDAPVIVLRSVEDDRPAFECIGICRIGQVRSLGKKPNDTHLQPSARANK